jgi:AraC family transcriptional regulator
VNKLRSDACCTLRQPIVAQGDVRPGFIPAGTYVVAHHQGPYPTLDAAWDWLFNSWFPSTDLEIVDGISFELYLNDPEQVAPDFLLTDLYVPVIGGPARSVNPWGPPQTNLPF